MRCENCGHEWANIAGRVRELLNIMAPNWMTVYELADRIEEIGGAPPKLNSIRAALARDAYQSRWRGRFKEYSW